jgi:hypothetical protein
MRRLLLLILCVLLPLLVSDAQGVKNSNGAFALHWAGSHDASTNTCDFQLLDVMTLATTAPAGAGHYDVYVIAIDVVGIAQARFGLICEGSFLFYGWTACADSDVPSAGWPDCGEGITVSWTAEQPGPHVTMGILDLYVYGTPATLGTAPDPQVGYAEFCDGTQPDPICAQFQGNNWCRFCYVGFGESGFCWCDLPVDETTWGAVKALYR